MALNDTAEGSLHVTSIMAYDMAIIMLVPYYQSVTPSRHGQSRMRRESLGYRHERGGLLMSPLLTAPVLFFGS